MMNVVDLRELIQDDIITCMDSHFGEVEYVQEVETQLCQIVVDRISKFEKGKLSDRDLLWEAIEILLKLDEKELAFQLRVVYDTNYREGWK